ncbi:MAG: tetratricopeptide repeat protein [Nitrospina sp.]|jgi:tetratricopeptide (TPR) repeat protein|nr:tetratricopeptide repeat protein [Nitrospina sp.]MBT3509792.1 tetratricopeptide repeat protein [Nitrospina sp.]MBT3874891.1 tetratricopeptide repeat protein [Nitrospina sp.]MBT4049790.1 tetratricopeptide repeat protein [Nitrospina sp.]MBT4558728.1 tetratricopeptide repeat protein [Nitrospina sp.]
MNSTKKVIILTALFLTTILSGHAIATYPSPDIAHWDLSISDEKNDPDYQKVRDLVAQKQFAEALAIIGEKIASKPREATPEILKAMVLYENDEPKKALEALLTGFKKERQHPALHFAFCQIHRKLGNGQTSEKACIIAAEQHRNNPLAHYEFALTLMAKGKAKEADKELLKSIRLDPKNSKYPYERGMVLNYLNQNDEAEKSFKQAFSLDKNNIEAAYQLAYLYATKNNKEQALTYINQILDNHRDKPKANSAKLLKEYIFKNTTEELPLKVIPGQYHLNRSKSLYQSKQYGLSIIEGETAARLSPNDLKVQEILVGIHSMFLRLDRAEKSVEQFIKSAKDDEKLKSRGYQEWGDITVLRGHLNKAREMYEKAKKLGDPNGIAKASLAELPEDVETTERQPLNPNSLFIDPIEALNRKGEIFAAFGMYQRALGIYSMVLRMDPSNLTALLNTATANYNNEKYNRTISILERLFIIHPNHEHIIAHRLLLARAYVMKGDLGDGIKNLEMILRLNPGVKKVIVSDPVFEKLRGLESFQALVQ